MAHDGDGATWRVLRGMRRHRPGLRRQKSIDEIVAETGLSAILIEPGVHLRARGAGGDRLPQGQPGDRGAGARAGVERPCQLQRPLSRCSPHHPARWNAGLTVTADPYGEGDLPRTAEIATMAGWDTDCNAGKAIVGNAPATTAGLGASTASPSTDFSAVASGDRHDYTRSASSFARERAACAAPGRGCRRSGRGFRPRRQLRFRCWGATTPSTEPQRSPLRLRTKRHTDDAKAAGNPARSASADRGAASSGSSSSPR